MACNLVLYSLYSTSDKYFIVKIGFISSIFFIFLCKHYHEWSCDYTNLHLHSANWVLICSSSGVSYWLTLSCLWAEWLQNLHLQSGFFLNLRESGVSCATILLSSFEELMVAPFCYCVFSWSLYLFVHRQNRSCVQKLSWLLQS